MKVYVVEGCINYKGCLILKIFHECAKKELKEYVQGFYPERSFSRDFDEIFSGFWSSNLKKWMKPNSDLDSILVEIKEVQGCEVNEI